MTGMIDRLVRDGLLTRAQDPNDRRKYRISLTDAGIEKYHIITKKIQEKI